MAADALPPPAAKGQVGIGSRGRTIRGEAIGIEALGVVPEVRVAVQGIDRHEDRGADRDRLRQGVRAASALLAEAPFEAVVERVLVDDSGTPADVLADDDAIDRWIDRSSSSFSHATSTCAMGTVVDELGSHSASVSCRETGIVLVLRVFSRVMAGDSLAVVLPTQLAAAPVQSPA